MIRIDFIYFVLNEPFTIIESKLVIFLHENTGHHLIIVQFAILLYLLTGNFTSLSGNFFQLLNLVNKFDRFRYLCSMINV